jgi:hypothetical protein
MVSSKPKHNSPKSVGPKDSAQQTRDGTPREPHSTSEVPPSPKDCNNSNNGTKDAEPWWRKKLIEKLTLTAILAYTVVSSLQWCAMQKSNEINQEALESVQRAFVSMIRIENNQILTQSGCVTAYEFWQIWENGGTTPAILLGLNIKIERLSKEPDEADFRKGEISHRMHFLGPKATLRSKARLIPPTTLAPDTCLPNDVFVWGWVVYKDSFPNTKLHITEFCSKLDNTFLASPRGGAVTVIWEACQKHNCVDDYCEDHEDIVDMAVSHKIPPNSK